ncbi:MAG: DNA mismatch repair protein MutS [Proteobacteria bacterium]|nr:DNA mismatch repair protein MutS [Pseudomonadota bacterium]
MKSSSLETPMMRQYLAIKAEHPDAIVFYRMGDFYEMFLDDATRAAPLLDIALTTRDKGKPDAVPMCGVPVHAADQHVKRLAELGHRVAICEQVEDPKSAGGRLVKRRVVEVVTPGLVGDPSGLESATEVAVVAIAPGTGAGSVGLAALDASTGDFRATDVACADADAGCPELLAEELERIEPREVLVPEEQLEEARRHLAARLPNAVFTAVGSDSYRPDRAPVVPEGFDPDAETPATRASAALLAYLGVNQPFALAHAPRLRRYALGDSMVLDAATRSHLELFENSEDGGRRGTLFERLDETKTPLGARRLARCLAYPLLSPAAIAERQNAVEGLAERDRVRQQVREALAEVRDLERLLAKATRPGATPRDVGALRGSLQALPAVAARLEAEWDGLAPGRPSALPRVEPLPELTELLTEALVDDPPAIARGSRGANETGYIRVGYRPELDVLRESASKGREWMAGLETRERERTGIATLKVRFHPVHGYSLEVTKAQLDKVPEDYERKQTLASVERFTTAELREMESRVLGANDKAAALERDLFEELRREIVAAASRVRATAESVGELDALQALAEVARREAWVRPVVDDSLGLEIGGGRHPVVEAMLARGGGDAFVPNDTALDPEDIQMLLLTGPNMSGKSTYLRQVALIALLAQMGSFVPADAARVGAVDRIFTRVGASDRLARGESTFMVEMRETAEILRQASRRSLVILDEIGRGTSTYDGLAIAWAVAEYLHDTPGLQARTLFATHYHELTDLVEAKERVSNAHFEAREWNDEVVFLRRLVPGGANRSYGIQVARLAGLPAAVITRARELLQRLEAEEQGGDGRPRLASARSGDSAQLGLFAPSAPPAPEEADVLARLRETDPEATTPLEALTLLTELVARLRGGT